MDIKDTENKPLKTKVDEMYDAWSDKKKKKIKIPRKAKVGRSKIKKGFVGLLRIDENGNISGYKTKIEGSSYNSSKNIYHATDRTEILKWEGKYPILIQPTWKKNPLYIAKETGEINETYGQPYIKAKMLKDVILVKKNAGMGIAWIIGIAVAGYIAYSIFTGGI